MKILFAQDSSLRILYSSYWTWVFAFTNFGYIVRAQYLEKTTVLVLLH